MKRIESEQLLNEHGIKSTANRIVIVETLSVIHNPMSLSDLENKILTMDKSSIFRVLTLFKNHHLVHVIEDGGDGVRYELCLNHSKDDDEDMHVHFYCEKCHRTFCFKDTRIPEVVLPDGYKMTNINYMVKGICPDCANK
jgi:Fur family ferric uptake transcriptional regulator